VRHGRAAGRLLRRGATVVPHPHESRRTMPSDLAL